MLKKRLLGLVVLILSLVLTLVGCSKPQEIPKGTSNASQPIQEVAKADTEQSEKQPEVIKDAKAPDPYSVSNPEIADVVNQYLAKAYDYGAKENYKPEVLLSYWAVDNTWDVTNKSSKVNIPRSTIYNRPSHSSEFIKKPVIIVTHVVGDEALVYSKCITKSSGTSFDTLDQFTCALIFKLVKVDGKWKLAEYSADEEPSNSTDFSSFESAPYEYAKKVLEEKGITDVKYIDMQELNNTNIYFSGAYEGKTGLAMVTIGKSSKATKKFDMGVTFFNMGNIADTQFFTD